MSNDFVWSAEELTDSKDMEERHEYKKWSEKYPLLDFFGFIVFAPIFKLVEAIIYMKE